MRAVRALTGRAMTGLAVSADQPWLPGLPHAVAGLASALVFGLGPSMAGMLVAGLVAFVVYLPLMALALNGGRAIGPNAPAPAMPVWAQVVLLGLWTATVWGVAAIGA